MSTTPPQSGLKAILECCRDIEVECARLYAIFAAAHFTDPKIQALWQKTAKEENNHADQVRLALRLDGALDGISVSVDEAREMRSEMRRLVAEVRKKVPTIPEALQMAIELERKLAAFHVAQAAQFSPGAPKTLFEA